MKKYWYVVQKKTGGEYLIGFCYSNPAFGESAVLESIERVLSGKGL